MNGDALYLLDIAASLRKIEELVAEGSDSFTQSWRVQDAAIRNFEVIGEAVKHLSPALKVAYPVVPWRRIAGLRDVLIRDYQQVNLDTVWYSMEHDLPPFRQQVDMIIQQLGLPQNGES